MPISGMLALWQRFRVCQGLFRFFTRVYIPNTSLVGVTKLFFDLAVTIEDISFLSGKVSKSTVFEFGGTVYWASCSLSKSQSDLYGHCVSISGW